MLRLLDGENLISGNIVQRLADSAGPADFNLSNPLVTRRAEVHTTITRGRVAHRRGAGMFVAPPKIHFNKLMSYPEQMSGRGLAVSSRVLSLSIVHTEQEIAARLALPSTSRLVKVERLRVGGDEPCAIETCYFSADEFAGLTRAKLDRVSLFSILEQDYGLQIAHADEEVDATTADVQTARLLDIPVGAAVLRIRQKIYSTRGKPGLYVLGLYRSDRHSLFIRRFR